MKILPLIMLFSVCFLETSSFASQQKPALSNESLILKLKENLNTLETARKQRLNQLTDAEKTKLNSEIKSIKEQLETLEKSQSIVQGLKSQGLVPESAKVEKSIDPEALVASRIIFIKDRNTCPIVAKVFGSVASFISEHKRITRAVSYAELINELRKNCGHKLPIIVGPRGGVVIEGVGVMLLEEAKGEPLNNYFTALSSMTDDRVKTLFSKIGEQFGNLDVIMLQNTGELLIHEDGHAKNTFFDEPNNQVYWIDVGGYHHLKMIKNSNGLEKLVFVQELLPPLGSNPSNNVKLVKTLHNSIRKRLHALQAFAQAYYDKNKQDGVKTYFNEKADYIKELKSLINRYNAKVKELNLTLDVLDFEKDYAIK